MSSNPCEAANATQTDSPTRPTRWMIVVGTVALLLAGLCLLTSGVVMLSSFQSIGDSITAPKPSDLAAGISAAAIPSYAFVPLTIVGAVFLILGFVRRQPVSTK